MQTARWRLVLVALRHMCMRVAVVGEGRKAPGTEYIAAGTCQRKATVKVEKSKPALGAAVGQTRLDEDVAQQ